MRRGIGTVIGVLMLGGGLAAAQTVERFGVESTVGVDQFVGTGAGDRPETIVDVTATARLGRGWVATIRPWFRQAPTDPYAVAKEIYQAAVQHERSGRIATRIDLGYIVSPIGLGMMDMRPDTNPTILTHLSYMIPMPAFDPGAPAVRPIAASYPLGGQVTASTARWDMRGAVLAAPPNRMFVLNAPSPNPSSRPFALVGGGVTPKIGLRVGVTYGTGDYATRAELTRSPAVQGRLLQMASVEGEFAFGYSKLSGEFTHDSIETSSGHAHATQWFVQGVHTLTPRWFVAGRHEGVNAPARQIGGARPVLRISELTAGFRISPEFTLRSSVAARRTYFDRQSATHAGVSLVWTRRWW